MSGEDSRPRRAIQPENEGQVVPTAPDPTAAQGPRYGARAAGPGPQGSPPTGPEPQVNPFARPGSASSARPVPRAPEPVAAATAPAAPTPPPPSATPIPAPVMPRASEQRSDQPNPAPRRSATSSASPAERPSRRGPAAQWFSLHRKSLITWGVAALSGTLAVCLIAYFAVSALRSAPPAESQSPTSSSSPAPATEADLLTPQDLASIAKTTWSEVNTTKSAQDHKEKVVCLRTKKDEQNTAYSFQRLLSTSETNQLLSGLHRIDVFGSPEAATEAMTARIKALSSCDEEPVRIIDAARVDGLAQQSFQITVASQEADLTKYHTVLMTRAGAAVQTFDVFQSNKPVEAAKLPAPLIRPQTELCKRQGVQCPTGTPAVTPALVPVAQPPGWLIPSDLPRIRPGAGNWNAEAPATLDHKGMGCENMTLASEPGPSSREQVTYTLTNDDKRPERFGMDEMLFKFPDNAKAGAFAKKLSDALANCKKRVNTAAVTPYKPVGVAPGGIRVSSNLYTIKQATGNNTNLEFQLMVSTAGNKVAYILVTVADSYRFTEAQMGEIATRAGVRATQGK